MLWPFIQSCAAGSLPFAECLPLYQLAAIAIGVGLALIVLVTVVLQRSTAGEPQPPSGHELKPELRR